MNLPPEQEKYANQIAQLARDSWDAGWKAACEEFVKIADERDPYTAIMAMRTFL